MKVGVGSANPVKVAAVREGMQNVLRVKDMQDQLAELQVDGYAVPSNVSPQPFSDQETRQGAANRARAVLQADTECDIAVGLEGGVYEQDGTLWNVVWVVVRDQAEQEVPFCGNRFPLPADLVAGLRDGYEMGDVMDALEGESQLKHKEGMFGVMTQGVISRQQGYQILVEFALALYFSDRYWRG